MMSEYLQTAHRFLLEPTGLEDYQISQTLGLLMGAQIDYADLYFQYSRNESWSLNEGAIKSGSCNIEQGVGVRAVIGEKTGFAYSDEILVPSLTEAALAAKAIAEQGNSANPVAIKRREPNILRIYQPVDPIGSWDDDKKVSLIKDVEQVARTLDPRVSQVSISLTGGQDIVLLVRSDGLMAADVRPLVRMNVTVIVDEKGRREQGVSGGGGRVDYRYFVSENRAHSYAKEAVRQALVNLESMDAPAGEMNVVLGPGWPGILLHEAVGHGLEGDFNRKHTSAFSSRIGDRVASELCTVVDDGTIHNRRGSLSIDDEGEPSQNTVLIENGILKGYMQDQLNARLMNMSPTGNGRRESFAHLPMPRMTNTYMYGGKHEPQEIIESVEKGLYAVNFGGGQVDITSGKFVFTASEAYMIDKGKITYPVKGATLIGSGPEVLTRVSMLGNDMAFDNGVGVCEKDGQSIPVGVGQPTMKIDKLTVGGVSI